MSRNLHRRSAAALALTVFLAILTALPATPVSAAATGSTAPAAQEQPADPCPGDLEELAPGSGLCSHGPDPTPTGLNAAIDVKPVDPSSASGGHPASEFRHHCDGDGVSGPRFQLAYVVSAEDPDRYELYKQSIQIWAEQASDLLNYSAQKTGGERRIRFVHDEACNPTVLNVTLPPGSTDDVLDTIFDFRDTPHYNSSLTRNFAFFVDSNLACGLGTLTHDDQPGFANRANDGGLFALAYSGCWDAEVVAHEIGHTLGAVQYSAPNSTGLGHCNDGSDIMCYSDGGSKSAYREVCREDGLFDCNNDDYLHTDPPAGSYLASHWNLANSAFLIGADPYKVCPDQLTEPNEGPAGAAALPIYMWSPPGQPNWKQLFTYAACTAGDQDWFSVPLNHRLSYQVSIVDARPGSSLLFEVYALGGKQLVAMGKAGPHKPGTIVNPRQSGDYFLKVWDTGAAPPSTRNVYSIRITPVPDFQGAEAAGATAGVLEGVGLNAFGEMGIDPLQTVLATAPTQPFLPYHARSISTGLFHTLIYGGGSVYPIGWNAYGQLGDYFRGLDSHWARGPLYLVGNAVTTLIEVVQGSAGMIHSLALHQDGSVWVWGSNSFNQLGDGTATDSISAMKLNGFDHVQELSAGALHNLALKEDGTVWAWGWNAFGQLGDGTTTQRAAPVQVPGLSNIVSVSAGLAHSFAIDKNGTVWAWGWNAYGQLGDGTTTDRPAPVKVGGLAGVYHVSAGYMHSLAVGVDGSVWAWGSSLFQQAGGGADRLMPQRVVSSSDPSCPREQGSNRMAKATWVSAGAYHSAVLTADGSIWTWGWNGFYQLGNRTNVDSGTPVKLLAKEGLEVTAGSYNTLYARVDPKLMTP